MLGLAATITIIITGAVITCLGMETTITITCLGAETTAIGALSVAIVITTHMMSGTLVTGWMKWKTLLTTIIIMAVLILMGAHMVMVALALMVLLLVIMVALVLTVLLRDMAHLQVTVLLQAMRRNSKHHNSRRQHLSRHRHRGNLRSYLVRKALFMRAFLCTG
jgi:hypothetical protein